MAVQLIQFKYRGHPKLEGGELIDSVEYTADLTTEQYLVLQGLKDHIYVKAQQLFGLCNGVIVRETSVSVFFSKRLQGKQEKFIRSVLFAWIQAEALGRDEKRIRYLSNARRRRKEAESE